MLRRLLVASNLFARFRRHSNAGRYKVHRCDESKKPGSLAPVLTLFATDIQAPLNNNHSQILPSLSLAVTEGVSSFRKEA